MLAVLAESWCLGVILVCISQFSLLLLGLITPPSSKKEMMKYKTGSPSHTAVFLFSLLLPSVRGRFSNRIRDVINMTVVRHLKVLNLLNSYSRI